MLLQLVAKELLTDYQDHFGELDWLGTTRFVADAAIEAVVERVGGRRILQRLLDATPGRGDEADLLDRRWHLELFDFRETHLLDTVARRLRQAPKADDPFAVFTAAQPHMLSAARAHVDSVLLQAFVDGIEACPDAAERALLERVCDLFALSTIEDERAWFAEHGRLTAPRSKAVIAEVDALCQRLRPHARTLVDAFGVPDESLAAPIAFH